MIYLGADHRGFKLKEKIKKSLENLGYLYQDFGNEIFDSKDDYPDFAEKVARKIYQNPKNRGILICGSGVGMSIVANKFKNVRATLGFNEKVTRVTRQHSDPNILCLPADFLSQKEAEKIVKIWLQTKFNQEEKHKRRIKKIRNLEQNENYTDS